MSASVGAPAATWRAGALYALIAYSAWGLAPAYWKLLASLPASELLAQRALWTFGLASLLVVASRQGRAWRALCREPRAAGTLVTTGLLIGANWVIFIWAVSHDRIVDTSLGYYLTPLLNVLLGVLVLGERLRPLQALAVGLAALGVARMALGLGFLPWISLALGGSFALYGLLRKLVPVPSLLALASETAVMSPLAVVYLAVLAWRGEAATLQGEALPVGGVGLLAGTALVTALPLVCFASAARRLPLAAVGIFQYLAPSLSLLLAVAVYGEPFSAAQQQTFAAIACALALYTWDSFRAARQEGRGAGAPRPPGVATSPGSGS